MLLAISSSLHAVAITPAEPTGAVASLPRWRRPSLNLSQVGFRIALFEACSAFTSRYGLHLRQVAYQRPSTPKASTALLPPPLLRLLPAGATLTGRVSHPLKIAAFPRRTEKIGLEHTLIGLSADHGGPDTPGYSKSLGIPGGYVDPKSWDRESAIVRLKQEFNIGGELIEKYQHPYIYLSPQIASRSDTEREAIERAVAAELTRFHEVSLAISSRALEYGNLPDTELIRAVLRNFNAKRSGDVYVVFKPNWFINDFDGLVVASTHGSPWRYDSFVPVVFAGSDIRQQRIHRRIFTVDVARTLAAYLGTRPPSGATGTVLHEVLNK